MVPRAETCCEGKKKDKIMLKIESSNFLVMTKRSRSLTDECAPSLP
jgi:hypothetical protein